MLFLEAQDWFHVTFLGAVIPELGMAGTFDSGKFSIDGQQVTFVIEIIGVRRPIRGAVN
jgi:hypothetical protein